MVFFFAPRLIGQLPRSVGEYVRQIPTGLVSKGLHSIMRLSKKTMRQHAMRVGLVLLAAVLGTHSSLAQDADTTAWEKNLIGNASLTQVGFQNWSEGGVNSLAISTGIDGTFSRISGPWEQTHEARLAYGVVKQDTLDFRKAEDLILLKSAFTYRGEGFFQRFNPIIAATLRTQFYEGLNFDKDPTGAGRELPVKVSDFFSPATLTQSIGLSYRPSPWFSQRLGLAAKETIVMIERLRPLYAVDTDKTARIEGGVEAVSRINKEIATNVRYKSSLSVFAAFNQADKPDIIWENLVAMKVNSWLNVNFEFVALWDRDINREIQLKEVFAVGFSYILL